VNRGVKNGQKTKWFEGHLIRTLLREVSQMTNWGIGEIGAGWCSAVWNGHTVSN
jgi:hypothetical protein